MFLGAFIKSIEDLLFWQSSPPALEFYSRSFCRLEYELVIELIGSIDPLGNWNSQHSKVNFKKKSHSRVFTATDDLLMMSPVQTSRTWTIFRSFTMAWCSKNMLIKISAYSCATFQHFIHFIFSLEDRKILLQ